MSSGPEDKSAQNAVAHSIPFSNERWYRFHTMPLVKRTRGAKSRYSLACISIVEVVFRRLGEVREQLLQRLPDIDGHRAFPSSARAGILPNVRGLGLALDFSECPSRWSVRRNIRLVSVLNKTLGVDPAETNSAPRNCLPSQAFGRGGFRVARRVRQPNGHADPLAVMPRVLSEAGPRGRVCWAEPRTLGDIRGDEEAGRCWPQRAFPESNFGPPRVPRFETLS